MLGVEAFGYTHHPAPRVLFARRAGAADNVLTHEDDGRIAAHFLINRFIDGVFHTDCASHCFLRNYYVSVQ